MNLYTQPDPATARAAAQKLITALPAVRSPSSPAWVAPWPPGGPNYWPPWPATASPTWPTENLNLKIKNTKRKARGYRNFRNYHCDYFSTTAACAKMAPYRGSEPAVPASWSRAGNRN